MNPEQHTILIAEDSPTQATSLQELLEGQGLCVLRAPDGPQALEMAQEHLPDVIVLDIEMPGMNGLEVAANLSREPRTQNIPVIMLTTHDSTKMAQKGFVLGAVDFIPKDIFAQAVLLETLRQLDVLKPD